MRALRRKSAPAEGVCTIPLTRGKVAIVDAADYERLAAHKWYCTNEGYAARGGGSRPTTLMHRAVIECQDGEQVDHIDGDRLNNARSNLRVCSLTQNQWNRPPKSGEYKGVRKVLNRFRAEIRGNGKRIQVGSFMTAEEAARAYDAAAVAYFGEFAWLNFPEQKERPEPKPVTLSQIGARGASLTRDHSNIALTLIRVQPSASAARGRGLVRFLTDLTERPIPAVATCDHCERMYNVAVDLSDHSNPVVLHLPSNCRGCGHSMDRYETIRDLIGSARHYAETAHLVNQFEDGGAA